MSIGSGSGDAFDAEVDTTADAPPEDPVAIARAVVASAEAKVEKQRAHLASAEQALASAQDALAELEAG